MKRLEEIKLKLKTEQKISKNSKFLFYFRKC